MSASEALTNYRWQWADSKSGAGNRDGIFNSDGTFRNPAGAGGTVYQWSVTGKFSFTLTNGKYVNSFNFNQDFTRFEGSMQPKNSRVVGTRGEAVSQSGPSENRSDKQQDKSNVPLIEVLSDHAPLVADWITAPLDVPVPGEIRRNMTIPEGSAS